MFCPVCRLEYRPGFTKCSDCDAALVEQLPDEDDSKASGPPADPEAMEVLWAGANDRVFSAVCNALDEANIRYDVRSLKLRLIAAAQNESSEILIRAADYETASSVLQNLMGNPSNEQQPTGAELLKDSGGVNPYRPIWQAGTGPRDDYSRGAPFDSLVPSLQEEKEREEPTPNDIVEDFDPNNATREIWAGESKMAQTIQSCLDDVGLGCVADDRGGEVHILVQPGDEKRAREVIREIIEQEPMP